LQLIKVFFFIVLKFFTFNTEIYENIIQKKDTKKKKGANKKILNLTSLKMKDKEFLKLDLNFMVNIRTGLLLSQIKQVLFVLEDSVKYIECKKI